MYGNARTSIKCSCRIPWKRCVCNFRQPAYQPELLVGCRAWVRVGVRSRACLADDQMLRQQQHEWRGSSGAAERNRAGGLVPHFFFRCACRRERPNVCGSTCTRMVASASAGTHSSGYRAYKVHSEIHGTMRCKRFLAAGIARFHNRECSG